MKKNDFIKIIYLKLIKIYTFASIASLFGIAFISPKYLEYLDVFIKTSVSLLLALIFNPYNKFKFNNLDKKIVFSSALLLFSTTALHNFLKIYIIKTSNFNYLYSYVF